MADNDFDGDDEFYDDDDVEGLNDPQVRHLPPEPQISGNAVVTDIDGDRAMAPIGLPGSAKLYGQAALFENAVQFRVFWMREGIPVGIGIIEKDASEEDFIKKFLPSMPGPGEIGKYRLRLLDASGNSIGHEAAVTIAGDHAHLRRLRGTEHNGGSLHIPGLDVVRDQIAGAQLRQQMEFEAVREERRLQAEERRELNRDRVELASQAAQGVQVLAEQMTERERAHAERVMREQNERSREALEAERTRAEQQVNMTQGFFSAMMAQTTAINQARSDADRSAAEERQREWARERERMEMRARQEREEYETRRAQDREEAELRRRQAEAEAEERRRRSDEEWNRRIEREREEGRERRAREDREANERAARFEADLRIREQDAQRRHEMRMEELRQSAAADREHMQQMAALSAQRGGTLEATLVKAASIAKLLGFDLKDGGKFIKELIGSDSGQSAGLTTVLDTAVDQIGAIVQKSIEARTAQMQLEAARSGMPLMPGMPPLLGQDIDDDDDDDDEPAPPPRRTRPVARQPVVTPPPAGTPAAAPAEPQAAPEAAVSPEAAGAAANLAHQRAARNALRKLAAKLSTATPDQYVDIVLAAIGGEPSLLMVIEPVGLARALAEAGLPENVAQHVHQAAQADGRLPPDVFAGGVQQ